MDSLEKEQPAYTVIDLVAADEQEAYSMVFEDEACPDCKSMTNNPLRSNDGLLGIVTGVGFCYEVETLTKSAALELIQTDNWKSTEESI